MKKVSVIIPCKNRLEHLKQTLPTVLMQSYQELEIIVVDYNCPQNTGEWVLAYYNANIKHPVKVVYADVDANEWSLSAARNLGYKHSTGEILLFLDADALLTDLNFITKHVEYCVEGSFVCGWGWHDATGCMMCYKSAFEAAKGYNELIKSWGAEDIKMYDRLQHDLANEKRVWLGGIETIKHGDEWRNYYHGGRNPLETNDENFKITEHKGI